MLSTNENETDTDETVNEPGYAGQNHQILNQHRSINHVIQLIQQDTLQMKTLEKVSTTSQESKFEGSSKR